MIRKVELYQTSDNVFFVDINDAEQYEKAKLYSKKLQLHINLNKYLSLCNRLKRSTLPSLHAAYLEAKQKYLKLACEKHNFDLLIDVGSELKNSKDKLNTAICNYRDYKKTLKALRKEFVKYKNVKTNFVLVNKGKLLIDLQED